MSGSRIKRSSSRRSSKRHSNRNLSRKQKNVKSDKSDKSLSRKSNILSHALKRLDNLYKNDGSGKVQYGGADINDMVAKIVSNRVLDVYLKYLGLTMLNSATLVPFALIMGKEYFEDYIAPRLERESGGSNSKKKQIGGGEPLPRVVPFFDHPYIGTFLKIAGIPLVGLTTNTLVPLGILMIVYEMIKQLMDGSESKSASKSKSKSASLRRRSIQRGGSGSQYAAGSLYAFDGNAPVTRSYEQCTQFATPSDCCKAALHTQSIQNAIVPPETRYDALRPQLSCSTTQ
jgi:hypothetical protein